MASAVRQSTLLVFVRRHSPLYLFNFL